MKASGFCGFGLRRERVAVKCVGMALKDILPLDMLFGDSERRESHPIDSHVENPVGRKKKKKVDREALASPLMRVPRMDVRAARDLLDLGIRELYELQGRSPEALFEDAKARKPDLPEHRLPYFRLAVYFAETEEPEQHKLHPEAWMD